MLVVADSSPLIVLINIEQIEILPRLFEKIVIPKEVFEELTHSNRPPSVQQLVKSTPSWLEVKVPRQIEQIPQLHPGEVAAISLARELKADLLLIDETLGRKAAAERSIPFAGTIGVLEMAAAKGMIDLQKAFERIKTTDFWISYELLDERLRLFREREESN